MAPAHTTGNTYSLLLTTRAFCCIWIYVHLQAGIASRLWASHHIFMPIYLRFRFACHHEEALWCSRLCVSQTLSSSAIHESHLQPPSSGFRSCKEDCEGRLPGVQLGRQKDLLSGNARFEQRQSHQILPIPFLRLRPSQAESLMT